MDIIGYHYTISPLEKILPKLLQKVLTSGQRAVVFDPDHEQLKRIDTFLWTYSKSELIPHGTVEDGNASFQPIWLTHMEENPNHAELIVVIGEHWPSYLRAFKKALILSTEWSNKAIDLATSMGNFLLWSESSDGGWVNVELPKNL